MNNKIVKIHGEDGPVSIFMAKRRKYLTLKQLFHKCRCNLRRKRIEKSITAEIQHSMDEVLAYAANECGMVELESDLDEVREAYEELRASFMIQYKPELLGEHARMPRLENDTPEAVMEQMNKIKKQKQCARAVSKELFDVDVHILRKDGADIKVIIETTHGYIGGSACGDKNIEELEDIMVKLHRYYGVTQYDIDNQTQRYKNLVSTLCR